MNSSEPFGSHFINHLFPCVESCPIRMKSFGSLSRADKQVDLLGLEAEGQAARSRRRRSTSEQEQPTPRPTLQPSPSTLHPPPSSSKQKQPRLEAAQVTENLRWPHIYCVSDSAVTLHSRRTTTHPAHHHSPASPENCP